MGPHRYTTIIAQVGLCSIPLCKHILTLTAWHLQCSPSTPVIIWKWSRGRVILRITWRSLLYMKSIKVSHVSGRYSNTIQSYLSHLSLVWASPIVSSDTDTGRFGNTTQTHLCRMLTCYAAYTNTKTYLH